MACCHIQYISSCKFQLATTDHQAKNCTFQLLNHMSYYFAAHLVQQCFLSKSKCDLKVFLRILVSLFSFAVLLKNLFHLLQHPSERMLMAKQYLISCCLKHCFIILFSFVCKLVQAYICLRIIYHNIIYFKQLQAEASSNIEVEAGHSVSLAQAISCVAWHVRCVPAWAIIHCSTKEWIIILSELEDTI